MKYLNLNLQKGFSVLEVMLAAAIFAVFAGGFAVAIISGFNSNRLSGEELVAANFAAEGLEAVKSIKNQAFSLLSDTAGTGVARTGGVWIFSGSNNIFDSGRYTRVIKIEGVNRNDTPPKGDIVLSGSLDPLTKKVTSTVTWNFSSAKTNSFSLSTYLSDWEKPIVSGGPIMMAYSKTTNVPFYRTWDGSTWSAEASAQTVGGNINYIVLKSSRTRNEAILGTLAANGEIHAQIWNGTSWSSPTLMANIGSANATTRSFDIDYEKNGDRAVFVNLSSPTSADFAYQYWDGNTWSGATTITTPPTTGLIKWIELAQNPVSTSNDIAMIMFDANADIYGMIWNGTAWGTMGDSSVWDATASTSTAKKAIDVAYEQTSGRAMFIWGDATATDQYYRIWNGSSLTAATLLDIPAFAGVTEWVRLATRPNSNELLFGGQDAQRDLNTRKWSGSAWDSATQHAEHSGAVENITSMNFDLVWETHSSNPGKAWLVWGDGATVSKKQWSGSAWGASSVLTGSDDTSFIRLKADPASGAIFAGIYEAAVSATDDIWESRLTGGVTTWSAKNTLWGGPVSAEPVHFRIDITTP